MLQVCGSRWADLLTRMPQEKEMAEVVETGDIRHRVAVPGSGRVNVCGVKFTIGEREGLEGLNVILR